jgi:hypothetical protein
MSETLPALPLEWIKKVFARFNAVYGPALMRGTWGDGDLSETWNVWAYELRNFGNHGQAIKYALEHLPTEYPPNLLAFKSLCQEGLKREEKPLALERKLTHEEIEFGRIRAENLVQQVKQPSNHRKWIYDLRDRINQGQSVSVEVARILQEAESIEKNEHPETYAEFAK